MTTPTSQTSPQFPRDDLPSDPSLCRCGAPPTAFKRNPVTGIFAKCLSCAAVDRYQLDPQDQRTLPIPDHINRPLWPWSTPMIPSGITRPSPSTSSTWTATWRSPPPPHPAKHWSSTSSPSRWSPTIQTPPPSFSTLQRPSPTASSSAESCQNRLQGWAPPPCSRSWATTRSTAASSPGHGNHPRHDPRRGACLDAQNGAGPQIAAFLRRLRLVITGETSVPVDGPGGGAAFIFRRIAAAICSVGNPQAPRAPGGHSTLRGPVSTWKTWRVSPSSGST